MQFVNVVSLIISVFIWYSLSVSQTVMFECSYLFWQIVVLALFVND